jgi:DNA-binding MarR family transcriptional regulator
MRWQAREVLLDYLKEPRTIYDVVEELEGNYYTIRRQIQELVKEGVVKELPYRRDKRSVFVTTTKARRGLIEIGLGEGKGVRTLAQLLDGIERNKAVNLLDILACCLGELAYASWAKHFGVPIGDMERPKAKEFITLVMKQMRTYMFICEQLLMEQRLWLDEESEIWKLFGLETAEGINYLSDKMRQYVSLSSQKKPLIL